MNKNKSIGMKQPILPFAVYSTKEAAELLGLNVATILKYINEKDLLKNHITAKKIGTGKKIKYRILGIDLLMFLGLFSGTSKSKVMADIVMRHSLDTHHAPDPKP